MARDAKYNNDYFHRRREEGRHAAQVLVPMLLDLVQPTSAIDVGCGSGAWVAELQQRGIEDVIGVDGDWVDVAALPFERGRFISANLEKPFELERGFDLATCLEVAEHLPSQRANGLVKDLCRLAPVVAFSAAIPHQGGTGHVNEQWPGYWAEMFASEGFAAFDYVRPRVWEMPIPFWYAQNTVLYVRNSFVPALPGIEPYRVVMPLSLVHPQLYARSWKSAQPSFLRRAARTMRRLLPSYRVGM